MSGVGQVNFSAPDSPDSTIAVWIGPGTLEPACCGYETDRRPTCQHLVPHNLCMRANTMCIVQDRSGPFQGLGAQHDDFDFLGDLFLAQGVPFEDKFGHVFLQPLNGLVHVLKTP